MSDPAFAKLLEACGLKPADFEGPTVDDRGESIIEKVAALVKRAIEDERRRCMRIATQERDTWCELAERIGSQDVRALAYSKSNACGKIARLIGEGL
jgi:hypothetical protein